MEHSNADQFLPSSSELTSERAPESVRERHLIHRRLRNRCLVDAYATHSSLYSTRRSGHRSYTEKSCSLAESDSASDSVASGGRSLSWRLGLAGSAGCCISAPWLVAIERQHQHCPSITEPFDHSADTDGQYFGQADLWTG